MKELQTVIIEIDLPEKYLDLLLQEAAYRMTSKRGAIATVESLCVEIISDFLDVVEQNKTNRDNLAKG